MDHASFLYIGACNVGISSFLSLVFNCVQVVIDLPPSWSHQVNTEVISKFVPLQKWYGLGLAFQANLFVARHACQSSILDYFSFQRSLTTTPNLSVIHNIKGVTWPLPWRITVTNHSAWLLLLFFIKSEFLCHDICQHRTWWTINLIDFIGNNSFINKMKSDINVLCSVVESWVPWDL